ncbi:MAG: acyltransferase [Proteobacteria bacterium]|nr:acyltransferase [Pseudomonadota bacterium]
MNVPPAHYRPEIDGLRAVAVLMVLAFHAGISGGGYVGVDVFYVISGYLICGIVLREDGAFSFARFYERRVRRIMPALLTMLAATALFSFILLPADMASYARSLVSATVFASNFYFWHSLGYFGVDPQYAPLLHTWSLAVEEQLYIVWPIVIVALSARSGRRGVAFAIAALALGAVLVGLLVVDRIPRAAFFLPVYRSAEFLLGAFLATGIVPKITSRWIGDVLAALGLIAVLANLPWAHPSPAFPHLEILSACVGTALILYGTDLRNTLVARILGLRPIVLIGQSSYSLYLWHWPIIAFGTYYVLDPHSAAWLKIVLALAAIPVAFASWHFIERPFRSPRAILSRRQVFIGAAAVSAALALFGATVARLHGLPARFDATTNAILAEGNHAWNPCYAQSPQSVADGRLCIVGDPAAKPSFVVSGDSHADMYDVALDELARRNRVSGYIFSESGCRGYVTDVQAGGETNCARRNVEIYKLIRKLRPKALVIIQRWTTANVARREEASNPTAAHWLAEMHRGLDDLVQLARDSGARIVIVRDTPETSDLIAPNMAKARALGLDDAAGNPPAELVRGATRAEYRASEAANSEMFAAFSARVPVLFLDPAAILCPAERCLTQRGGYPLYRDTHHLSLAGARLVMPAFAPLMKLLTARGTTSR